MKRHPPLVAEVGRSLERLGAGAGGMVVAVSGGPDSVALLRALAELPVGPLVVAHLNHRLRGAESDADEAFVQELARSLRDAGKPVEARTRKIDVAAQARQEHGNLESVARRLRYDWLQEIAVEAKLSWIATGHTADDQAETVLHRLLRGTGLQGLRGIAARRSLAPGIDVVRPLLRVRRTEIIDFLDRLGQPHRLDSSNQDLRLTRNRIRLKLLPHLARRYNPEIVALLGRLAAQAESTYRETAALADQVLAGAERPRAGPLLVFDRRQLAAAPRHLLREVFRRVWRREGWPAGDMSFAAWDRLAAVALGELAAIDLPGGLRARSTERVVQVGPPE